MVHPLDRKLEELAIEATRTGMSRLTFMKRALALGISATAIASALEAIEGPTGANAAGAPQVSLTFSSWGSLDEQITVNKLLEIFQKRYPNITVQPRYTDFGDYFTKLNADVATKSIADVLFLTYVPTYAAKGAIQDIRPALKAGGRSLKGYTPGQLFLFEYAGGVYGVPRDTDTKVIFYNRKLFKQAGVAYPKDGWSYDDLRTTAKALTKGSGARISQYGYAYETDFWRLWLWQNGVELFDNNAKPTKATFNTPAGAQALQFIADLTNVDQVTPPPSQMASSAGIASLFSSGQLAMAFGNHALVPTFVRTKGLDWFVVGMPHFTGHPTVNASGGAGYAISKWTKQRDAAYKLWNFFTGTFAIETFSAGNDVTPITPSVLKSAAWLSKPYNKIFAQQTKYGHLFPSFASVGDVFNVVGSDLDKVWIGEQSAADALPKAEKDANKVIKAGV